MNRYLALSMLILGTVSCAHSQLSQPQIGALLPRDARVDGALEMESSASMQPRYVLARDHMEYIVCTDRQRHLTYIRPTGVAFRTPEGIGVGDSLEHVLAVSASPVIREPGWAFVVELPSGWHAAFTQGSWATGSDPVTEGENVLPGATVKWLFQRR